METKEKIMQSAIKCTGLYGLEEVRTRRIAQDCGLSESNIYRFFSGKDELLQACYDAVDSRIAGFCRRMGAAPEGDTEEIFRARWVRLFRFLLQHPEDTVFYYHFRASRIVDAGPAARADTVITALLPDSWRGGYAKSRQLCNDYLLHNSVYFACQVLSGGLENSRETADRVCGLLYGGVWATARAGEAYEEETA